MNDTNTNSYCASNKIADVHPRKVRGSRGSNCCPSCNAAIDRWKVGNTVRTIRCDGCQSKLWMEFGWRFFIANAVALVIIYLACVILPRYLAPQAFQLAMLPGFQLVVGIIWPIALIILRIVFGYPVAYRNPH